MSQFHTSQKKYEISRIFSQSIAMKMMKQNVVFVKVGPQIAKASVNVTGRRRVLPNNVCNAVSDWSTTEHQAMRYFLLESSVSTC